METEKIRSLLADKAKKRGELKSFCEANEIPYFTIWRFANRKTDKLDHDLGSLLSSVLTELAAESKEVANG